jgi:sensor histidine kinase YesM
VLAAWTLIAVVHAVSSSLTYALMYRPPLWGRTFGLALTEWYAWAALTPLVVWLAHRFHLRPGAWLGRGALLAAIGLPLVMLKVALTRTVRTWIGVTEYFLLSNLISHYLIYWGIIAIVHALDYYRAERLRELRASQAETHLAEARLQLLRMQLHPHFLFNTLNAIAELVHEDPKAAETMIGGLSRLLRETLDAGAVDRVPLSRELELLDQYVGIQRVRFGDRLKLQVHVDGRAANEALVPIFILQPLVENAIKHGLASHRGAGRIDISAAREGERLIVDVRDDGPGLRGGEASNGVGLTNTRARLAELYGAACAFDIANVDGGGVSVRLAIPWQTE